MDRPLVQQHSAQLAFPRRRLIVDRRQWFVRRDDLLVLGLEMENLQVVEGKEKDEAAHLERLGPGTARLIVTLPPQNIAEVAYFTTVPNYPLPDTDDDAIKGTGDEPLGEIPIDSRIAGWSRLVFSVRDEDLPIEWTLEGVLSAIPGLELRVAPNALPPRDPPPRFRPLFELEMLPAETITQLFATGARAGVVQEAGAPGVDQLADVAAARSALAMSRGLQSKRTLGHVLGLSEASGSATLDKLDVAIADPFLNPLPLRPAPRSPTSGETALELPYRLIVSPNSHAAWFHAEQAVHKEATGHTELWHTRLGVRTTDGKLVDGPDPLRTLRAIWSTDSWVTGSYPPTTPPLGQPVPIPDHKREPFRASLDAYDRHNVVHLSSNFQLREKGSATRFYEPRALDVDLLALSALGGWLDSRGVWGEGRPAGLSVEEWRHRATLGRDHYVRVVYAGRLFPLGHRASLVKITERRFETDRPGHPAYLRQRMFIIVREPLRTYGKSGLKYDGSDTARAGERWDLMLPFKAARITTRVSPLLDPPEKSEVAPDEEQSAFWPFVADQPFLFHVIATDHDDRPVELALPLIFVDDNRGDAPHGSSIVHGAVASSYATRKWPGSTQLLSTVPLGGQRVAFAESNAPDDTTFAAASITLGAEVPSAATYDKMNLREPRYVPVLRTSKLAVPALQQIARANQPAALIYDQTFLRHGFDAQNAGAVFLAADKTATALAVKFSSQADRSGGFFAPDLSLSGLSRITGPVAGDVALIAAGTFDPQAWFGPIANARLFGAVKLSQILESTGVNVLDALPRFVGELADQVQRTVADLERLRTLLAVDSLPQASLVRTLLEQLVAPTTGSITKLLGGSGDVAAVAGQLAALETALDQLEGALRGGVAGLAAGPAAVLLESVESMRTTLEKLDLSLLTKFAQGDLLPTALASRFDWRPVLRSTAIFKPSDTRNLLLAVRARDDELSVTCSLDDFVLDLEVLILSFQRVQFRARTGKKPEIDVAFDGFEFAGPLRFVETLRALVPLDGFSDPPAVKVTPEGITAGFQMGLPNIAVGVFSLENLSLAAGFSVPFVGPPMSTWFRFCERENPARLTVSLFGGGFFFGVTVGADGLQVAEGAIEFGAAVSVNFGVASGSVSAMAGLYFRLEAELKLAGYFRLRGQVRALGIVSVCIELYLEMSYETGSNKCVGTATISVEIDVTLWSTTIKITCTKKFAGSGGDPTLAETLDIAPDFTSTDWNEYCEAFAA
jgi:hypothetical protein